MKQIRHRQSTLGFTIIEVLIVLAITMFVFTIIFVAVPALQRNKRNFTRKHAVELVGGALEQFNNLYGHYPSSPTDAAAFNTMNPEISNRFTLSFRSGSDDHAYWPPFDTIAVQYAHWCNRYGDGDAADEPIAGNDINPNLYVVWTILEPSSPTDRNQLCIDNYQH